MNSPVVEETRRDIALLPFADSERTESHDELKITGCQTHSRCFSSLSFFFSMGEEGLRDSWIVGSSRACGFPLGIIQACE